MVDSIIVHDDGDETANWPSRREVAGIAAFWAVYGVLSVFNGLYPPGRQAVPATGSWILGWALEPILWMMATPFVFWLTSRFSGDEVRKTSRVALYVVAGFGLALIVDLLVELAHRQLPPPMPSGATAGFGNPGPRPLWALTRGRYLSQCVMCMAIFGAGIARSYVTRYRQRLEESAQLRTELAEARLAMLRSQLNPHFLYNTLNAISALVEIDPPGVRRMIARLSELLRIALEPSESAEVPLSKELGITERYLDILRIRFEGRLDASVDASPELYGALVPPMILQPLVENAMKHAVGKSAARSQIRITAERSGEALVLRVRDSGPGSLNGAFVGATDEQNNDGVGLRNTRARLREIYGTDCSLVLERTDSGGMEATIRLPFHTMADLRATPAGNPND